MTSRTKRILAASAASLMLSLATVALLQGFAFLSNRGAHATMDEWEEIGKVRDAEEWESTFARLRLARRLGPLSADYSADMGRLMEWQSWRQGLDTEAYRSSRELADRFYLDAIGRRPSWGFAWAHYAENMLLQGNSGTRFQGALRKAIELAPWEPGVQRKVAWQGMATWDRLPEDLRSMVRENIERAVQLDVYRYEIVRLAIQFDWLQHLEPMMRSESQLATFNLVLKQSGKR